MKTKEWAKLKFHDPQEILLKMREIQQVVAESDLPEPVKSLRSKPLKPYLERWHSAIFCHGMKTVVDTTVYYAPVEKDDYDCIAYWEDDGEAKFTPIQMKELVPETLPTKTNLTEEIGKLAKYKSSDDLVVALYVNRAGTLEFSKIEVPKLTIGELWLFGNLTAGQSQWFLYGDLLKNPRYYEFTHPAC